MRREGERERERERERKREGERERERKREGGGVCSHISTVSLLLKQTLRSIIQLATASHVRCCKTLDHHYTVATAIPLCLGDVIYLWIKTVEPEGGLVKEYRTIHRTKILINRILEYMILYEITRHLSCKF